MLISTNAAAGSQLATPCFAKLRGVASWDRSSFVLSVVLVIFLAFVSLSLVAFCLCALQKSPLHRHARPNSHWRATRKCKWDLLLQMGVFTLDCQQICVLASSVDWA